MGKLGLFFFLLLCNFPPSVLYCGEQLPFALSLLHCPCMSSPTSTLLHNISKTQILFHVPYCFTSPLLKYSSLCLQHLWSCSWLYSLSVRLKPLSELAVLPVPPVALHLSFSGSLSVSHQPQSNHLPTFNYTLIDESLPSTLIVL